MNLDEFYKAYKQFRYRDEVIVPCSRPGCLNRETIHKDSAARNIRQNDNQFLCRKCSLTDEGRATISRVNSYERSPEVRQRMADSANLKWSSEWGQQQKKRLAQLATKQHRSVKLDKSKRKILFISAKNNNELRACNSSYEYIYCEQLEQDAGVVNYQTQVAYNDGNRSLDFLISLANGSKKVVEIKPKKRLHEDYHRNQIADSRANAIANGWAFEVVTEDELGIHNSKEATRRADDYRKKHYALDYGAHRAEGGRRKAKRHYDKTISIDTVTFFCDYCQTDHSQLQITYDNNVKKNGRHICHSENSHISRPSKTKKDNPYAQEGRKQCVKCERILDFDCFGADKSRRDGYASRCKECRNKEASASYVKKAKDIRK